MPDSLSVVREFVGNARPLLDSLTALHFARRRIATLEGQLERTRQERDQMAGLATNARSDVGSWQQQLLEAQAETIRWRSRYRTANGERWLLRLGLAASVGLSLSF